MIPRARRTIRVNALSYANLIACLIDGDMTLAELAAETGLHYQTVIQQTKALHHAKAIHICAWERNSRGAPAIKIYKLGRGVDAKSNPLTRAQISANYKARQRIAMAHRALAGVATGVAA